MDTFVEFLVVFRALHRSRERDCADDARHRQSLAAGRPIYRRRRTRDPASALFALLHAGDAPLRPSGAGRAFRRPVHAGHGRPRDLSPSAKGNGSRRPRCGSRRAPDGRRAILIEGGDEIEIGPIEKMSKSKRNTVDPDDIIATYGADTARWFMLSDSPPERDVIWTEAGIQGACRQTQRLWRLVCEIERIVGAARPRHAGVVLARTRTKSARRRMARSPRSRAKSSNCASTSASRRSTNSPTFSARPSARSRRPRSPTICASPSPKRANSGAAVRADDAASGRGMLVRARPCRRWSPKALGRSSTAR